MTYEKKFEKRVLAYYRKKGAIAEHLGGPEGWPDITAVWNYGQCDLIELKSSRGCKVENLDIMPLFEKSQIAFFLKYPRHEFFIMVECSDGVYLARIKPEGKTLSERLGNFHLVADFD